MMNFLRLNREPDGIEELLVQTIGRIASGELNADSLPTLPKTKGGAGWWIVGGAATLGIGGIILGAVALALAGILLTDDE
jgi:hypothetical protein